MTKEEGAKPELHLKPDVVIERADDAHVRAVAERLLKKRMGLMMALAGR